MSLQFLKHPDYQALLSTIVANPLDDGPKLVSADWLEENGYEWKSKSIVNGYEYRQVARELARRSLLNIKLVDTPELKEDLEEWAERGRALDRRYGYMLDDELSWIQHKKYAKYVSVTWCDSGFISGVKFKPSIFQDTRSTDVQEVIKKLFTENPIKVATIEEIDPLRRYIFPEIRGAEEIKSDVWWRTAKENWLIPTIVNFGNIGEFWHSLDPKQYEKFDGSAWDCAGYPNATKAWIELSKAIVRCGRQIAGLEEITFDADYEIDFLNNNFIPGLISVDEMKELKINGSDFANPLTVSG